MWEAPDRGVGVTGGADPGAPMSPGGRSPAVAALGAGSGHIRSAPRRARDVATEVGQLPSKTGVSGYP